MQIIKKLLVITPILLALHLFHYIQLVAELGHPFP